MSDERCDCGQPLHYINPNTRKQMEETVKLLGPLTTIVTPQGKWKVPRHYIALHGVAEQELSTLAVRYQWERVL